MCGPLRWQMMLLNSAGRADAANRSGTQVLAQSVGVSKNSLISNPVFCWIVQSLWQNAYLFSHLLKLMFLWQCVQLFVARQCSLICLGVAWKGCWTSDDSVMSWARLQWKLNFFFMFLSDCLYPWVLACLKVKQDVCWVGMDQRYVILITKNQAKNEAGCYRISISSHVNCLSGIASCNLVILKKN